VIVTVQSQRQHGTGFELSSELDREGVGSHRPEQRRCRGVALLASEERYRRPYRLPPRDRPKWGPLTHRSCAGTDAHGCLRCRSGNCTLIRISRPCVVPPRSSVFIRGTEPSVSPSQVSSQGTRPCRSCAWPSKAIAGKCGGLFDAIGPGTRCRYSYFTGLCTVADVVGVCGSHLSQGVALLRSQGTGGTIGGRLLRWRRHKAKPAEGIHGHGGMSHDRKQVGAVGADVVGA
jgi:hypothetical protein